MKKKIVANSTVSSKYQVVIPKEIRRAYDIGAGQRLQFVAEGDGVLVLRTKLDMEQLASKYDDVWGRDGSDEQGIKTSEHLKQLHEEWEQGQGRLDALRG